MLFFIRARFSGRQTYAEQFSPMSIIGLTVFRLKAVAHFMGSRICYAALLGLTPRLYAAARAAGWKRGPRFLKKGRFL
jgi:hypothetical protein